jgi:hypothetical protein
MMELEQLLRDLALLEQTLEQRVAIYRIIVDTDGKEIRRIRRGSFQPRAPQGEAQSQGERK